MSLQTCAFLPRNMRSIMIGICRYANKNPMGYIYSPFFGEMRSFSSAMELLISLEGLMDDRKSPRSTTALRGASARRIAGRELPERPKAMATFKVDVLFRHNSSWQGNLVWLEGGREAQFRSVLELLFLMDNALSGAA